MSVGKIFTVLVLFIYFNATLIKCAKILAVYPTPSFSHQIVFRSLTNELVRQGHEVTVITTDPEHPKGQAPSNLLEIDIHDVSYKIWKEMLKSNITGNPLFSQMNSFYGAITKIVESFLVFKDVQDILNKQKNYYDLIILESFVKIALIFTHFFKAPAIHFCSFGGTQYNHEVVGAALHPLLYPMSYHHRVYNLTYYEKIQQLYQRWIIENIFFYYEDEEHKILQKMFGQDIPSIRELSDNIDLLFLNYRSLWAANQPIPTNVVFIGGIHTSKPKALPNDLALLLDKSKNGVIYFSLGTNVDTTLLSTEKIQTMVKVFSKLPYDIIWKCNHDYIPGITENVKLVKWVPQSDLLNHPNIKMFITQGGLQSTDEAIEAGVPLIGIPIIADQWYNVEKYEYFKIGIHLELSKLTEDVFNKTIHSVITDKSYRENILKLRAIMKDEPQPPMERAIWWIEYLLRHGGAKHFRAAGANMPWAKYFELEVVAIVVLALFVVLMSFYLILIYFTKMIVNVFFPIDKIKRS